ncbi:MAG: hypothetical protein EPN14_03070 [Gallionella sp.]|nr:MAG: hypothetical protein EPN14_03070 [Gallionella sp.]
MSNIKLFESQYIRSFWDDEAQRWFFAVVDVVAALSESKNPQVYWRVLKKRLLSEGNETVTNCNALKMTAPDGKQRLTDVADTEQLLRLIQSIPSPKAEPFKRWLAKVGCERLEEIENPELAAMRMRELYKAKGYSDEWIEKRVRGIAIRDELTNEWKKRGVKEQREYFILTAEISLVGWARFCAHAVRVATAWAQNRAHPTWLLGLEQGEQILQLRRVGTPLCPRGFNILE